jgi:L-serine dehydratase
MESIKEIYKIGRGPSSSHTMAPFSAARLFHLSFPDAENIRVIFYGSLAKTGKGHMSDLAVKEGFSPQKVSIKFDTKTLLPHPITMDIKAKAEGKPLFWRVLSLGGGRIQIEGNKQEKESKQGGSEQKAEPTSKNLDLPAYMQKDQKGDFPISSAAPLAKYDAENANGRIIKNPSVYDLSKFDTIKSFCTKNDYRLFEYAKSVEGEELFDYLRQVWRAMKASIEQGLAATGVIDGGLGVVRKAKSLYNQRHIDESSETRENRLVCAFAYAVSEQNASGGQIVTAPTCGACGVLPAVLRYVQLRRGYSDEEIVNALATAGVVGNLIKTNASISGAECGCQAEIGSACSMAAAALGELYGMSLDQIEYAAEICIEHHLGLTCDPIGGLVQIPCIERNAVAAMRAINAVSLANFLTGSRQISFDSIVQTMYETGRDLPQSYRETSESGMAKLNWIKQNKN